jgi:hypothetical protein
MDADNASVSERINELSQTLIDNGFAATLQLASQLIEQSPVFLVIPKWSIDTWARFILEPKHEDALDETKTCKLRYSKSDFTLLGKSLAEIDLSSAIAPESLLITYNNAKNKKAQLKL